MALRPPTAEQLRDLAQANYFELNDEEVAAFQSLLPGMFAALEALEQAPSNLPPIKYRERDAGCRPSREKDPLNAIVRRCSVKGAKSGKLAGKRLGIKDNVCIAGIPMTCASLVLDGYVPDIDATIITHSLVPYTGIVGIDATFDHTGPMGRSVADVALLLEVIAGKDPMDPRQYDVPVQPYSQALGKALRGVRIGLLREGFGTPGFDPQVDAKVRAAIQSLRELGAQVQEVSVPAHLEAGGIIWALLAEGMAALVYGNGVGYHWSGLYNESLANAMGKSIQAQGQDLPAQIKFTVMVGAYLNRAYHGRLYAKAQNQRRTLRAAYDRVLDQVDVLV